MNNQTLSNKQQAILTILNTYNNISIEQITDLIEATNGINGVSFVKLRGYSSDKSNHTEIADQLINVGASYANMIVKSYKSRSERSRAMFLLSSSSFLQAYKRAQYMKQYAGYRKNQGEEIINKSAEIEVQNKKLAEVKNEKIQLIAEQEKEKIALEEERKEQQKLVNSIKKDQKKLVAEINKNQKEAKEIDRKIQELIRAAIAEANKKTAKKSGTKTVSTGTSSSKIVLTPEGKIVSDNFKANKGRLPWPVKKGMRRW
jgi:septal ring factor EnvC (AmiA/AmiB activator)